MFRAGGYAISISGDGRVVECDTFTCCHCNTVVHVKPKQRAADMGGWCRLCAKAICSRCATSGVCDPMEEKLKRAEAAYHARRSYAIS